MRAALIALLIAVMFGPTSCMVVVAVMMSPASQQVCRPGGDLTVINVPDKLETTTADGTRVRLNNTQLSRAATIITTGGRTEGAGRDGVIIALMAALTESRLRMLSNVAAYPESEDYPNDGDGNDHDSLGMFQMRPSTGWGTVEQLMDPAYQSRAFFGGPAGPNRGLPPGLLDIPGWRNMPKGAAAQAVEVSAQPDRYATFEPVAEAILTALTRPPVGTSSDPPQVPDTTRVVFPLPAGTWVRTSGYGYRIHPITGTRTLHSGVDYAAPAGTAIMAAANGRVAFAGPASGYGYLIVIEHHVDGETVSSAYAHMQASGLHVQDGQTVLAGQYIGDIGSTGNSTGPHLHFEVRPGRAWADAVDPEPWLADHDARSLDVPITGTIDCASTENMNDG